MIRLLKHLSVGFTVFNERARMKYSFLYCSFRTQILHLYLADKPRIIRRFNDPNGWPLINILSRIGSTPAVLFGFYYVECPQQSNHHIDIKTSLLIEGGKPKIVMLDYYLDVSDEETNGSEREESQYKNGNSRSEFRLSYYPHKLSIFTNMLKEAFGSNAKHEIFGDFKSINMVENPAFYIHVIEKPTMQ